MHAFFFFLKKFYKLCLFLLFSNYLNSLSILSLNLLLLKNWIKSPNKALIPERTMDHGKSEELLKESKKNS